MSWFDFSKKEKSLIPYGCDIHSHLLPNLDDGSSSIDESLKMINQLVELGFVHFICTPHIMCDFYKNNYTSIKSSFDKLNTALTGKKINIKLEFSAEYYLDEGFVEKLKQNEIISFGDNYVLFETSYMNKPNNLEQVIFEMQTQGYKPILAHPERYTYFFDNFDKLIELHKTGVLFQINVNSLTGYYSKSSKKIAEKLIDHKMVDFLGTDCHKPKHIDVLKEAMKTKHYTKALGLKLKNQLLK